MQFYSTIDQLVIAHFYALSVCRTQYLLHQRCCFKEFRFLIYANWFCGLFQLSVSNSYQSDEAKSPPISPGVQVRKYQKCVQMHSASSSFVEGEVNDAK